MRKWIFLMLFLLGTAHASEHGLVLNLGSKHIVDNDYDYNEVNYGLGYTYYFNQYIALQTGIYYNSFEEWSTYVAGKGYVIGRETKVQPFIMFGLVTGYDDLPVRPILAGGADFEVAKTHKINIMAAPIEAAKNRNSYNRDSSFGILFGIQYEKLF